MNLEPLIYIGTGLILAFVYSYFIQRGKNEAMKKDLKDLTEKVEEVKSLFNLKFHTESNLWNEQRDALADFHQKFTLLSHALLDAAGPIVLGDNYDKRKHMRDLNELQVQVKLASFKILFYIDDNFICNIMNEVMLIANEEQEFITLEIAKYKHGDRISEMFNRPPELVVKANMIPNLLSQFSAESLAYLKKLRNLNK